MPEQIICIPDIFLTRQEYKTDLRKMQKKIRRCRIDQFWLQVCVGYIFGAMAVNLYEQNRRIKQLEKRLKSEDEKAG